MSVSAQGKKKKGPAGCLELGQSAITPREQTDISGLPLSAANAKLTLVPLFVHHKTNLIAINIRLRLVSYTYPQTTLKSPTELLSLGSVANILRA